MDSIFEAFDTKKARTIKGDFIDRLHSTYTVTLLFVICILVGLKQYEGAIVCWLPAFYSGDQAEYAHQLCWVNNTYYYPSINDADMFPETLKHVIPYYQFILFILFGQALLFYFPNLLWNFLVSDSAGYIKKVLDQVEQADLINKSIKKIGEELERRKNEKAEKQESKEEIQDGSFNENNNNHDNNNNNNNNENNEKLRCFTNDNLERVSDDVNNNQIQETSFLLLPREFSDNIKHTVHFSKEQRLKAKKQNKNSDHGLNLVNFKENSNNEYKKSFKDQDQHNEKSTSISQAKKRIISFMKPIRGAKNLAGSYMILKLVNFLNVVLQIFLLHYIFGWTFYKYGWDFLVKLFLDEQDPFTLSKQFPLITFCDFYVHQNLRQIYWHSTQCLLSINVYIEKFYVVIWFWMIMLFFVTLFNLVSWVIEIWGKDSTGFLKKYLGIKERMLHQNLNSKQYNSDDFEFDQEELYLFNKRYLGNDGFVMLHMIKAVIGDIIFIELLHELWNDFKINREKLE